MACRLPSIPCFSKPARTEPSWTDLNRVRGSRLPPGVGAWLRDAGSLTARLKSACRGRNFQVRVLVQGRDRPTAGESRLLGMKPGALALVREVDLLCDGVPWVFARTLIPITSLKGPARRLARIGDRPLGEILFADPRMRRGRTQAAQLLPGQDLFTRSVGRLADRPPEVWGRRTLYLLAGQPLLINEIFLPQLPGKHRCRQPR